MRSLSFLSLLTIAVAATAHAGERRAPVQVAASRLDRAILQIGRQTGTSIGLKDRSLAGIRTHGVSGTMEAAEALDRLLAGTAARARRVGPDTFVIEAAPRPRQARTAFAQANAAPSPPSVTGSEEIVVTASKRDTPLVDYPGTATIIDGDAVSLGEAGSGTDAIAARAASLTSTHLGPGRNKLFIRGIADSSFTGPTQSTVGQYWGNMRVTYSAPDPDLRLYDVQRIEVLEGPQGTLYGAGALGGIVRIVPTPPDLERIGGSGWLGVQATQHGDPGGDIGALLNVPVVEGRIGIRALGYAGRDGGYIDDRLRREDDVNRVRTYGARGSIRFAASPDWTVDLSGTFQSIAGDDAQYADRDDGGLSRGTP